MIVSDRLQVCLWFTRVCVQVRFENAGGDEVPSTQVADIRLLTSV